MQLAVRAEIGEGYSSPVSMVVGYLLLGADGKVVDSRGVERELRPLTDGVPSALQFAATISVEPGEYVLRVAATDGSRVGSAERKVSARLHEAGGLRTSDVIAGGPVYTTTSLQPTVTSTVAFGNLHAFVEAYGASAASTTVRFEVARMRDGPALMAADAVVRPAGARSRDLHAGHFRPAAASRPLPFACNRQHGWLRAHPIGPVAVYPDERVRDSPIINAVFGRNLSAGRRPDPTVRARGGVVYRGRARRDVAQSGRAGRKSPARRCPRPSRGMPREMARRIAVRQAARAGLRRVRTVCRRGTHAAALPGRPARRYRRAWRLAWNGSIRCAPQINRCLPRTSNRRARTGRDIESLTVRN